MNKKDLPTFDQYADLLEKLQTERARAAKLIDALKQGVVEKPMDIFGDHWNRVREAIVEYEAAHD